MYWNYMVFSTIGLVCGVSITFIFLTRYQMKKLISHNEDVTFTVTMLIRELFECAQKGDFTTGIDYLIKGKGQEYTTYLLGKAFFLIDQCRDKKEEPSDIENILYQYLSIALKDDVKAYKNQMYKKKSKT